jgi:kinesin family protein C2/C3
MTCIRDDITAQVDYQITVQMLEIYNETLRDLFIDPRGGGGGAANRLDILSTQASGCNVPGAVQVRTSVRMCVRVDRRVCARAHTNI